MNEGGSLYGPTGTVSSIYVFARSKEYAEQYFLEDAVTDRGVRIGDSKDKVREVYGMPAYPNQYDGYPGIDFFYDSSDRVDQVRIR